MLGMVHRVAQVLLASRGGGIHRQPCQVNRYELFKVTALRPRFHMRVIAHHDLDNLDAESTSSDGMGGFVQCSGASIGLVRRVERHLVKLRQFAFGHRHNRFRRS